MQALLDTKVSGEYLGALYFPPGRYRLESTLTFGFRTGYHVVGSGLPKPVRNGSTEQGAESVLVWGGADGGKMVEIQGTGLVWSALGLWGANTPTVGPTSSSSSSMQPRAQYGINFNKLTGSEGLGTGKVRFDSILVADCDVAIATSSEQQKNSDNIGFGYCWFENCGTGLHLTHEQAVKYTFQYLRAERVGTIIKVNQGGKLQTECISVLSSGTTVLDLLGGGKNNAYYQLGGVTLKPGIQNVYLLKNATGGGGQHQVRFTDGHFGDDDTSPSTTAFVDVNRTPGWTTLELVGCRGLAALTGRVTLKSNSSDRKTLFFARDCDIANVDTLIDPDSEHYIAYGIDNWTFANGFEGYSESPP